MSQKTFSLVIAVFFTSNISGCTPPFNSANTMQKQAPIHAEFAPISAATGPITRTNSEEKKVLSRLAHQLNDLHHLIDEAEFRANPDARIRFDYKRLRYDLMLISDGIKAHVESPVYTPRSIEPIRGEYRQNTLNQ